jgi:hypothetical protein
LTVYQAGSLSYRVEEAISPLAPFIAPDMISLEDRVMLFNKRESDVDKALTAALIRAEEQERQEGIVTLDITKDRLIIFSDLHKGTRDGADDFRFTERAYNAALAYYFHRGYIMASLGDVEELWENRRRPVFRAYRRSLALEGAFHQEGRLWRFWGNHDDNWRYPDEVKKHLERVFGGGPLTVYEALLVHVVDGEKPLGKLLLLHGHQGTLDSDRIPLISRFFVRYIWRPIQRLTRFSPNTPSKDWKLRHGHNNALYQWSERQEELVLIAGHTHRPVFKSMTHEAKILELLEQARGGLATRPDDESQLDQVSQLAAELEWVRVQEQQEPGLLGRVELKNPSYFNTGCCCYSDGDITGLEFANGRIALIRWPNSEQKPRPSELESASLEEVFAAL